MLMWDHPLQKGEVVDLSLLPNLRVSVAMGTAKHSDNRPSTYEGYQTLHSITHGRAGGLRVGDAY